MPAASTFLGCDGLAGLSAPSVPAGRLGRQRGDAGFVATVGIKPQSQQERSFRDSHLPLTTWFRAMWQVTSQKNGSDALGLQRVLGLGSYKTAWAMLHKLRRAMVRPGRDRLRGSSR